MEISLFQFYQGLKTILPYVPIADLPTPILKLNKLGTILGIEQLYMKRDDLSGKIYGGNKVRKLEFMLGKASKLNAAGILTSGFVGSSHVLATAIYGKQLGFNVTCMLLPQTSTEDVRTNLLMSWYCGANLLLYAEGTSMKMVANATQEQLRLFQEQYRTLPIVIPFGGTTPLGTIGFVNAAFELRQQIENSELPEPDIIYVALGSMGTTAGLILGLYAANIKSKIIAVQAVDPQFANEQRLIQILFETHALIRSADPSFPELHSSQLNFEIRHEFFRKKYDQFSSEEVEALEKISCTEGIKLEKIYTGKALAALIADSKKANLRNRTILFWNTYNTRNFSSYIKSIDYRELPLPFHRYFESRK